MKLFWGKRNLTGDWAQVELNINDSVRSMRVDGVVVLAALWGRKFDAYELVVPIERVGMSGIELMVPNLYARVANLDTLRDINSVWGVDGVAEDGGGQILRVPDSFVQELIERERREHTIRMGGFVRILWGPERMLCGTVRRLNGRSATVEV